MGIHRLIGVTTRSFRGIRAIRFGEFELEVRAAELRREGVKIRLQEQPYRILAMLLEKPGEVVLREELQRRLWPNDTVVEVGHGISAAVQRLREALGETAGSPRFIETLARRGYRFIGEVELVMRQHHSEPLVEPTPKPAAVAPGPPVPLRQSSGFEGRRVSHYRVIDRLGRGGMGVVYRAEDLKLGRQVALKFLPEDLASDPVALTRFQHEARAASALNHPHICTVYAVDDCAGQPAIAMELLEGETLEAVIAKGPLPCEKALTAAVQIAGALDAAHRKGVIHRDLKPANVFLTKSGVKVLDFGLAKMERPSPGAAAIRITGDSGVMGTLHYMSPEQVQGKDAGACGDIFSFGVLLYEMLTGQHAFDGPNSATVMAAILTAQPALLQTLNPMVEHILQRCLAKDPEERWQSARDLKAALEYAAAQSVALAKPVSVATKPSARSFKPWSWLGGIAATIAVSTAAIGGYSMFRATMENPPSPPPGLVMVMQKETPTQRLPLEAKPAKPVELKGDYALPDPLLRTIAITAPGSNSLSRISLSPNGRYVAYNSLNRLCVQEINSTDVHKFDFSVAGAPFWSPDSKSIAFHSQGRLMKIAIDGTEPTPIASINTNLPGSWGPDGTILVGLLKDGIYRIPAAGGTLAQVTSLDSLKHETRHFAPQFLPDGKRFLYLAGGEKTGESKLYVASLNGAEPKAIMNVESNVQFVKGVKDARQGHLVYVDHGMLMARQFDLQTLSVGGKSVALGAMEPVGSTRALDTAAEFADFSVSPNLVAYRPLRSANPANTMRKTSF